VPTIVMTGGTSGFGAIAAGRMAQLDDARLILGARQPTPAGESIPLDLTSLDSVRTFAASVGERLDGTGIDALVLNAGMIRHDDADRTVDGFETTFVVNYLSHYLMLRQLQSVLADGAIVVMTTSGTYDPATKAGLETPHHADAELLAHPDRDSHRHPKPRKAAEHAYTASKLCTILTARTLSELPAVRSRRVTVVAYDPGQVFGTGLARDLPLHMRVAWSLLGTPVLGRPLRRFSSTLNSRSDAGTRLANLTLGLEPIPEGRMYATLRRGKISWPDPSEMARNDELARRLWDDSARLVGLADTRA
jgi:NAD(P)-dependent dehydrogenase (short-subunit alcohol dehydrogenase family)